MKEADRKKRNEDWLSKLYPTFRTGLKKANVLLESSRIRPRIQDGWRSPADQKKVYASGHSKLLFGFQNVSAKGGTPEALAVNLLEDDSPLSPSRIYLLQLAAASEKAGLITGISWGVPRKLVKAIDQAITAKYCNTYVKVGWDTTHVQTNRYHGCRG